jgi:hypothetical protein
MNRFHNLFREPTETGMLSFAVDTAPGPGLEDVIDWEDGRPLLLRPGQTARCRSLNPGELYGVMLINRTQNDADIEVQVAWNPIEPPTIVTAAGSTGANGIVSIVFVSGADTRVLVVSVTSEQMGEVEVMLSSVTKPAKDAPPLAGAPKALNQPLPDTGEPQNFAKTPELLAVRRFVAEPEPGVWHQISVGSPINQFLVVQFRKERALVQVVNSTAIGTLPGQICAVGPTAPTSYEIQRACYQVATILLQGDGNPVAWLNLDSDQNAEYALIALQPV